MSSPAPAPEALRHMAALAGPDAAIDGVDPLAGGTHASTFLIRTKNPVAELVLREYPAGDDAAHREVHALTVLSGLDGLAPRLLADDADGCWSGRPSVVISRLPGSADIRPHDPSSWATRLGVALAVLHRSDGRDLPGVFGRPGGSERALAGPAAVPVRAKWSLLERAVPVLTHYDFWSGNVLWRNGAVSGVVDWNGAARGPAEFDLGWCRLDLVLLFGRNVADAFLAAYRATAPTAVDAELADLWAVARSYRDVETWVPNYRDLGRADLTAAELRRRHTAWTTDLLSADRPAPQDDRPEK